MKDAIASVGCAWLVIISIVLASIVGGVGWWGAKVYFAEEIGKGNAQIQIQSAPNRIGQYNMFFNECASIQTLEITIDTETEHLRRETDPTRKAQIETNIAGIQATRARAVANYNARASADYTSGQFQDSSLPFQIPLEYEAGGEKTVCADS